MSPSFLRILATRLPAVRSETESTLAIWRSVYPLVTRVPTARSRGLGQRATGCPELVFRPGPLLGTHPFRRRRARPPPRTSCPAFGDAASHASSSRQRAAKCRAVRALELTSAESRRVAEYMPTSTLRSHNPTTSVSGRCPETDVVAKSACLSRCPCWQLPAVSTYCTLSGVKSGVNPPAVSRHDESLRTLPIRCDGPPAFAPIISPLLPTATALRPYACRG